jgi:hypothetical protein
MRAYVVGRLRTLYMETGIQQADAVAGLLEEEGEVPGGPGGWLDVGVEGHEGMPVPVPVVMGEEYAHGLGLGLGLVPITSPGVAMSPGVMSTGVMSPGVLSTGIMSPAMMSPAMMSTGVMSPGLTKPEFDIVWA